MTKNTQKTPKMMKNSKKLNLSLPIGNKEILSEFVNLALASSRIKEIKLEQEKGIFNLRPNLNLFIYGSIASSKSTLLNQISDKTNCHSPLTDLSFPALIGSIDKMTRQILIGSCWDCRNSLLLLDEFDFSKRNKDDIRALLQLIESGKYNRKLASFSSPTKEEDEELFYEFQNGTFKIKTRFSLIVTTMKYPYSSQNKELQALVSRSITIPFYPTKEELIKIAKGNPIFQYQEKEIKEKVFIKKKDYNYILTYVSENLNGNFTNFLRIVGDCCRVFAVEGKHKKELYNLIIKFGMTEFKVKIDKKNEKK